MTRRNQDVRSRFQVEAAATVEEAWSRGVMRPAVVMATGSGKTRVMAHVALAAVERGERVLVLVHRHEILQETHKEFEDAGLSCAKLKAGEDFTAGKDVVIASVQTLGRRLPAWKRREFGVVMVDECHHAVSPTYQRIMRHFGCFGKVTKTLGVTATLTRSDKRPLGDVWDEAIYELNIREGIERGILVPPMAKSVYVETLDLKPVGLSGGDFRQSDLAKAVAQAKAGPVVARAYREHAMDINGEPRRGIVFCPSVAVAQAFLKAFRKEGICSKIVTGTTPIEERDRIYREVKSGVCRVIINVMVLTEGFNLPEVEVVVLARPTRAQPLYVQMVGRALRLSPGKTDALILDMCGRSARMGLITPLDLGLPVEVTGTWEQADRTVWEPPAPPRRLNFEELDAVSGKLGDLPATAMQRDMLRFLGVDDLPETMTAAEARDMIAARYGDWKKSA